jgi:hypothetical protein
MRRWTAMVPAHPDSMLQNLSSSLRAPSVIRDHRSPHNPPAGEPQEGEDDPGNSRAKDYPGLLRGYVRNHTLAAARMKCVAA